MDFFSRIAERAMGTQPIVHPIRNPRFGVEGSRIEESSTEEIESRPESLPNTINQEISPMPPVTGRPFPGDHQKKGIEPAGFLNEQDLMQESSRLSPRVDRPLPRIVQEKEILPSSIPKKQNPIQEFSTDEQTGTFERNQNVVVKPDVSNLERPRVEAKQTQQPKTLPTDEVFAARTIPTAEFLAATGLPTKFEKRIQQPQREREETEVNPKVSVFDDQQNSWPAPRQRSEPNQTSWGRRGLQRNHSEPPTIKVTIGRVEVRAIQESTPPPKQKVAKAKPSLSLETYLDQRKRGER